jgi:hypothetical protein
MTGHATPPRAINRNPVFDRRYRVRFRRLCNFESPSRVIKPATVTATTNSSVFWGGRVGRSVVPARRKHAHGHLTWTRYTTHQATATGAEWTREGPVTKAFVIDGKVKLHFHRLGLLTRLWVHIHYSANT